MAVFGGLADRLQNITDRMRGKSRVTEKDINDMMKEIRIALLEADVNYQVVKKFTKEVAEKAKGEDVLESLTPGQQVVKIVFEELVKILGEADAKFEYHPSGFTKIILYGLQGAGKTTTAAKLANYFKKQGKKPFLVSVDTHRPAAQEQLKVLAEQIDVDYYIEPEEKDASKIAQRGFDRAKYLMKDVLIVDTAGRTTIDNEMMEELQAIDEVVEAHEKLLVVDAMIGQEAVNIANSFQDEIGLDGFMMTKLDGDARGGAALSIYQMTGKPIKFIGTGEKIADLEQFHPDRYARRILGMGDVLSLIEKASESIDEEKAAKSMERLQSNKFTLDDMLDMFEQVQNMGPMKNVLGMIPGMKTSQIDDLDIDDRQLDYTKAIIRSMTPMEREDVSTLNASRRKRIAAGSGRTVQEVNQLVKQYRETLKLMDRMGVTNKGQKSGKRRRRRGGFNPFAGMGL